MCCECLAADGWLVLNCWREHRGDESLNANLRAHFPLIYSHTSQNGNWVIFAGKSKSSEVDALTLRELATAMTETSCFSLQSVLKRTTKLI